METASIVEQTAQQLSIKAVHIAAVIDLKDEGCTIPFISRYRKERTGNLDEVAVDAILKSYERIEALEKRREYIINYLEEQGKLTAELRKKLQASETLAGLEDLYLPFKPRKKTLADKAQELGLGPLAKSIKEKNLSRENALRLAKEYIGEDIPDVDAALEHAMNILVQEVADSSEARGRVRNVLKRGKITGRVKRGKKEAGEKYRDYFDFSEELSSVASHRIMALMRAAKEGILAVKVEDSNPGDVLPGQVMKLHFRKEGELLLLISGTSLERYLLKSIGNEVLAEMRERAEADSAAIFSRNLEKILLFSPFGERAVIGIDPGIRTGCKVTALDKTGGYLESMNINLHHNAGEASRLLEWIDKYSIEGIAIGDGTFGRESYGIVRTLLQDREIVIAMIDEDGASVYSAGETAREEFPDLDVTIRGAISIGRRFQDPLSELVKIDPKSLGVGQYQHDINTSLLKSTLEKTIEWAVNRVGVNLNTASYHLLSHVSGLDKKKAREITNYRSGQAKIQSREELKKVKGIGNKAFEQAAGFLRIKDGDNILDSTGVHPESYSAVQAIAASSKLSIAELVASPDSIDRKRIESSHKIAELDSIIDELKQKGLDPRREFQAVSFNDDINDISDLQAGMVLSGVVDNVLAFGAFVDIGIKDKGLVHISEVANEYVKDINDVLAVNDQVKVKVLDVDLNRKRIALSMKQV